MIPSENEEWNGMEFGVLDFVLLFILLIYIFFSQLNYYLDKHKEKNFLTT